MLKMTRILAGAAGLAALAAAAPSAAQYGYGYSPYSYGQYNNYNSYNSYGYAPAMNTSVAAQQCTAAVQNRLYTRRGLAGVLGSLIGASGTTPQVLSITRVTPSGYGMVRVRGLASSGRSAGGYGAYGMGAYGALGYGYGSQADLSFRCDVDARGYVRNVDINRRY
jgi:hypothetical protein